jgi:hypothetical protein
VCSSDLELKGIKMNAQFKPDRNYLILENDLDLVFQIDRVAVIETDEDAPIYQVFIVYGELVAYYQRLVGRRIFARELIAGKSDNQMIEDELQHLRNIIGSFTNRESETIDSEERFGKLVPIREQKKIWKAIFADLPLLLRFYNVFFIVALLFTLLGCILSIGLFYWLFPDWKNTVTLFVGVGFSLILVSVILLQIFYFQYRCRFHNLTLRRIAEKTVEAKKQFVDYPISSVEEIEPKIRQVLSENFNIPSDSLKKETRLDLELGFEF